MREEAHFSKHLRDVCVATVKGIDPKLIRERVDQTLKQERFVELDPERGRFTTRHIYEAIEGRWLTAAKEMSASTSRTVSDRKLERALADCPQALNPGQRDATTKIVQGPDLVTVQGLLRLGQDHDAQGGEGRDRAGWRERHRPLPDEPGRPRAQGQLGDHVLHAR